MSLRARMVASIALALLLSLTAGGLLAAWHARRSVRTELQAALDVATQTVRNAEPVPAPLSLLATFDGNRHVVATLQDAGGTPVAVSRVALPAAAPPRWLVRLLGPDLPPVTVALSAARPAARMVLRAEPTNEVSEVWGDQRDTATVLLLFSTVTCVLVLLLLGRVLRPLRALSAGFDRLGNGELAARVRPVGAPELRLLAQGFNEMAGRLATVEAHNRRLHQQLLSLQEEERAELARDLHDEIGPFLFAASMDAASIQHLAMAGQPAEVLARARSVQEAISHAQKHVRAILGRLRPMHKATLDLPAAIDDLLVLWRRQYPGIDLAAELALPADLPGDAARETIFRVVQEGLSNAVRHGHPRRVRITAGCEADGALVVQVRDDGQGARGGGEPGFGLIGMRERLGRLGGSLAVAHGQGWTLTARLPAMATRMGEPDEAAAGR